MLAHPGAWSNLYRRIDMFILTQKKTCKGCGETKPLSEFYKHAGCKDGTVGECKDCYHRKQREYQQRPEYKKRHKLVSRRWEINHPEQRREIQRNRVAKNPHKYYETKKQWRDANPDKTKEYRKRYDDANKEKLFIRAHKRRTTPGDWNPQAIRELKESYGFCVYCGKKKKLTIDHVVPIDRGGTNDMDNLVPACKSCNSRKNTKSLLSWLYYLLKGEK